MKTKIFNIFRYLLTLVIMVYTAIRGGLCIRDYVNDNRNIFIVGAICYFMITITAIIVLILLIKRSLYRRKFEHNDFE